MAFDYSSMKDQYVLMQGVRRVDAALLKGDWGPFWALRDKERDLIEMHGKAFLPFNYANGTGRILKGLGLHEMTTDAFVLLILFNDPHTLEERMLNLSREGISRQLNMNEAPVIEPNDRVCGILRSKRRLMV